jgi:hypothetical protein
MQPHEVFNAVAEQIQPLGYAGIVVLWDEFGFAIEEVLRGGQSGRSLGVEAQTLHLLTAVSRSMAHEQA